GVVCECAGFLASRNLTVIGNRIVANAGPFCIRSNHIMTIANNDFESNEGAVLCMDSSFDANITGNLFENNTAGGIQVYDSEGIRTFRNAFADNYVHGTSQLYESSPNHNAHADGDT